MSTYSPQFRDIKIIPDKFNTGPVNLGQLIKITEPQICGEVSFTARGTTDLALNILYDNTNRTAGEHVCENYDLTNFGSIILLNPSDGVTQRTFTFKNCKLRHFTVGGNNFFEPYLHFNFINCSFVDATVGARCAYFENCQFNNNDGDCLNGFHDFTLKNCYAYTYASAQSDGVHVDGIQIYEGNSNNILIDNCRFESLEYHGEHSTYINASLMLSIESSDPSNNITFIDTHVNGGGYSVYTCNKAGGDITNLRLHNIECGECSAFGTQYPSYMDTTYFLENDIKNFRELFVSSVINDEVNNKYQIIVSNDTLSPRILKVETDKGTTTFNIPASYQRTNVPDTVTSIEDYPVDLVKEIDSTGVNWIACFDATDENNPIQIRYVEFEPSPIEGYIDHIELNGTTYSIYDKEALHGNIVTTIDSSSTDNDIPTAKAVYDSIPVLTGKELISNKVTTISSESTDSEYPSAKCLYLLLGDLEDRLEDI